MSDPPAPIHPLVGLIRSFVVDWLDRADAPVCSRILHPDYTAVVGGVRLEGRDGSYLPATLTQLRRFPGLLVTVHEVFTSGSHVALRFTEHGASPERDLAAAWAGIGIFGWDGLRLTINVTEEDYLSRRRQFADRSADAVAAPATAPWSVRPDPADPDAEEAVRRWLQTGDLGEGGRVRLDDGWTGQPTPTLLKHQGLDIDTLFSAGSRVAFHATQHGTYLGGIDLPRQPIGAEVGLRCCGMVHVDPQSGVTGNLIRDRVGLRRDLIILAGGDE